MTRGYEDGTHAIGAFCTQTSETGGLNRRPQQPLDQSDFLKLRLDDVFVEGLHDVLVGAGM
jgi:hypothetical protein